MWAHLRKLLRAFIPRPVVRFVWNAVNDLKELPGRIVGKRPAQPFRIMHNVGGGDYHAIGRHYVALMERQAGLSAGDHVLDIGCGTGRVAAPLIERLGPEGSYTGFDVSRRAIDWARKHVADEHGGVRFVHVDLGNSEYNKAGRLDASKFPFPAQDDEVDIALATSLYSHLMPEEAAHFLKETGRVLKPGGRALLTAFLMTSDGFERVGNGNAQMAFEPLGDHAYTTEPGTPEEAIAFDEHVFLNWVKTAGLTLARPVQRGAWSDRTLTQALQDTILLEKRGS